MNVILFAEWPNTDLCFPNLSSTMQSTFKSKFNIPIQTV